MVWDNIDVVAHYNERDLLVLSLMGDMQDAKFLIGPSGMIERLNLRPRHALTGRSGKYGTERSTLPSVHFHI